VHLSASLLDCGGCAAIRIWRDRARVAAQTARNIAVTLIFAAEFSDRITVVTDTATTRPTSPCPTQIGALKACVDCATRSAITWAGSFDMSPCVHCPPPCSTPDPSVAWTSVRDKWLKKLNSHQNTHAPPGQSATVCVLGFDGSSAQATVLRDRGSAGSWFVDADSVALPIAIGYLESIGVNTGRSWVPISMGWSDAAEFERWAGVRIASARNWLAQKKRCVVVSPPIAAHHIYK